MWPLTREEASGDAGMAVSEEINALRHVTNVSISSAFGTETAQLWPIADDDQFKSTPDVYQYV